MKYIVCAVDESEEGEVANVEFYGPFDSEGDASFWAESFFFESGLKWSVEPLNSSDVF